MKGSRLKPYEQAAYQRGIRLLLEVHDILARVRTTNWQQAQVLNVVFVQLGQALEQLGEVSPNDLTRETRQALRAGFD